MNPAFGGIRNSIISLMTPGPCKRPNHGTLLQLLWKPCSSRTVFRACNPDGGGVTDRSMHFTVCVSPGCVWVDEARLSPGLDFVPIVYECFSTGKRKGNYSRFAAASGVIGPKPGIIQFSVQKLS